METTKRDLEREGWKNTNQYFAGMEIRKRETKIRLVKLLLEDGKVMVEREIETKK